MREVVKITGLQKNFGDFKALNDVSFTVNKDWKKAPDFSGQLKFYKIPLCHVQKN